jgi:hypothetical protein
MPGASQLIWCRCLASTFRGYIWLTLERALARKSLWARIEGDQLDRLTIETGFDRILLPSKVPE